MITQPTKSTLFPYTTLFRSQKAPWTPVAGEKPKPKDLVHVTIAAREGAQVKDPQPYQLVLGEGRAIPEVEEQDRKSTRLNSSHPSNSYAVFCLKKKNKDNRL